MDSRYRFIETWVFGVRNTMLLALEGDINVSLPGRERSQPTVLVANHWPFKAQLAVVGRGSGGWLGAGWGGYKARCTES